MVPRPRPHGRGAGPPLYCACLICVEPIKLRLSFRAMLGHGFQRERRGMMVDFVVRANIEHYRKLLQSEEDEAKRITIERLLSQEERKLEDLEQRD